MIFEYSEELNCNTKLALYELSDCSQFHTLLFSFHFTALLNAFYIIFIFSFFVFMILKREQVARNEMSTKATAHDHVESSLNHFSRSTTLFWPQLHQSVLAFV